MGAYGVDNSHQIRLSGTPVSSQTFKTSTRFIQELVSSLSCSKRWIKSGGGENRYLHFSRDIRPYILCKTLASLWDGTLALCGLDNAKRVWKNLPRQRWGRALTRGEPPYAEGPARALHFLPFNNSVTACCCFKSVQSQSVNHNEYAFAETQMIFHNGLL